MSTGDQAEELAEKILNEVASVRTRAGRAVEAAEELDGLLWQTEKSISKLPSPPQEADPTRPAAESTGPTQDQRRALLASADLPASDIKRSVPDSQAQVEEVRNELTAAAAALTKAKGSSTSSRTCPTTSPKGNSASRSRPAAGRPLCRLPRRRPPPGNR